MGNKNQFNQGASIQSVERALSILFMLADADGPLSVGEVAEKLGVHSSTASRLLSTLAQQNVVVQNRSGYQLGLGLLRLSHVVLSELTIRNRAHLHLQKLAKETGYTTYLATLFNRIELYLDEINASDDASRPVWVGRTIAPHCASSGKVLLAFLSEEKLNAYLAQGLPASTRNTITDPDQLRDQLALTRERGYATSQGEHLMGISSLGAPVFDKSGHNVAAIAISGPTSQFTGDRLIELASLVMAAGSAISLDLGYKPAGDSH